MPDPLNAPPVGPEVDATPRALPARMPIRGQHVVLEPLHRRHAAELWLAAKAGDPAADASWTYLSYGPFPSAKALAAFVADTAANHDPMAWAIRPVSTGLASGWVTLMDIQPRNAAIEIGNIWFSPALQRTRAATEAIFLLLRMAADDLGYRRLQWKCDMLNAPSRRAAERLGFVYEGTLRADRVVKGRQRSSAYFSILEDEWPLRRQAMQAWLDPANFTQSGNALRGLGEIRAALAAS